MSNDWIHRLGGIVSRRRREAGAATAGAVLLLVAATIMLAPDQPLAPGPTANVRVGPFADQLVEGGTIAASNFRIYSSAIGGGPAKIIEIACEGGSVKPGDVLVRFDATSFQQELVRDQAALKQAEADLTRAREAVRLEELSSEGTIQQAQQQIDYAESDLTNQEEGRGKLSVEEGKAAVAEAERQVERTFDTYEDLKPLLEEGFITRVELEQARRDWERAVEQKRLADLRLQTLVTYEGPAALNEARARVDAAHDELARREQGVVSRIEQSRAGLSRAQGRVQEIEARIVILEDRIANTVIRSEGSGLVVYRPLYFANEARKPQVGDEVWPNQPLIALPDTSELIVETQVREVDLHKVSASQNVAVTVDAYPDIRLPATVELVGALAQEDPDRAGTKFFPVTVRLLEVDPRLRTGMTARVEIEVTSLADALIVPAEAIFEDEGQRFCIVFRAGQTERRLVSVIADNGVETAVQGNLQEGDVLLLTDPSSADSNRSR